MFCDYSNRGGAFGGHGMNLDYPYVATVTKKLSFQCNVILIHLNLNVSSHTWIAQVC